MRQLTHHRKRTSKIIVLPDWVVWPLRHKAWFVGGLLALLVAYYPWLDHHAHSSDRRELCDTANAARNLALMFGPTYDMRELQVENIQLVGRGLEGLPVVEMPIMYQGRQIEFQEHPAVKAMMEMNRADQGITMIVADELEGMCQKPAPVAPHSLILALWPKNQTPIELPHEGPSLKPQEIAERG